MILPDTKLVERIINGDITVDPVDFPTKISEPNKSRCRQLVEQSDMIQPSSIDLELGDEFITFGTDFNKEYIDPYEDNKEYGEKINTNTYILNPDEFILGKTRQVVGVPPNLRGLVHGRSSWARVAVQPHLEAGYLDSGFIGQVTLEIANSGPMPIKIEAGRRFCQVEFAQLLEEAHEPYDGKYQHQGGAQKSRIEQDK